MISRTIWKKTHTSEFFKDYQNNMSPTDEYNIWNSITTETLFSVFIELFLRASSHFHALSDEETSTNQQLRNDLRASFCRTAEHEQHYRQFESRWFRSGEDPSVYRWELEEMLKMANASLTTDQRKALLTLQFMGGLPQHLQIILLEHDPSPHWKR